VFDKLAHDTDCRPPIFDLDGTSPLIRCSQNGADRFIPPSAVGTLGSHHLRQIRAPGAAYIIQVHRLLPGAVGRDLVGPFKQFGVDAVTLDQSI
jgi:hypothetical protein